MCNLFFYLYRQFYIILIIIIYNFNILNHTSPKTNSNKCTGSSDLAALKYLTVIEPPKVVSWAEIWSQ